MELGLREWIMVVSAMLMLVVVAHGLWIRRRNRSTLRMNIEKTVPRAEPGDEWDLLRAELPGGPARVIRTPAGDRAERERKSAGRSSSRPEPTISSRQTNPPVPARIEPSATVDAKSDAEVNTSGAGRTEADVPERALPEAASSEGASRASEARRPDVVLRVEDQPAEAAPAHEDEVGAGTEASASDEPLIATRGEVASGAVPTKVPNDAWQGSSDEHDLRNGVLHRAEVAEKLRAANNDRSRAAVTERPPRNTEPASPRVGDSGNDQSGMVRAQHEPRRAVEEIIVINVMSRDSVGFSGEQLVRTVSRAGLKFGDMNIFHRYRGGRPQRSRIEYSMANAVEPGTFDLSAMHESTTRGVSFFLQLPGPAQPLETLEHMLSVAREIATALDGELRDENLTVMTSQTIEHCRERVRDFARKQHLKSRV